MTDLEITRLCAEAMGWEFHEKGPDSGSVWSAARWKTGVELVMWDHNWHPLQDDAQAMALVKKFGLAIEKFQSQPWKVSRWNGVDWPEFHNADLNRAICECVAKMQAVK